MEEHYRPTSLKLVIESQGRTKRWVAAQAGFSESMLGHVLSGRKRITRGRAERISTALGVPLSVLFESTDQNASATEQIV